MDLCESEYQGYWLAPDDVGFNNNNNVLQVAFTNTWFKIQCEALNGYFEQGSCYVAAN